MEYDLAIIGAGWAGFNASIAAKNLGLNVCLIEKSNIGGTCLNLGCIPTKALLQSAKVFALANKAENFGIEIINPGFDFAKIQERKTKIIQQLQQGMKFLLKGIDYQNGEAKILSNNEIKIGAKTLKAKYILIATGSRPIELKQFKFDGKKILSSDHILDIDKVPASLLIIGGGIIGSEFASLFSALGSKVTVVELMPQLLPGVDKDLARKLETIFKKKGIDVRANTDAAAINLKNIEAILVCVGRKPNIEISGLERIGIRTDKGRIVVDEYLKTSINNIYAAGDCTGKIMLAHFAAYQGTIAAQNIASPNNPKKADNLNVPNCIFTEPEIASIGLSEEEAKQKSIGVILNKFDFLGSGMARIQDKTDGFIKILSDKNTEEVLGASIIGPGATELIAILTLAVSARLKLPQIRQTIFAHPTLSESIADALKSHHAA